MMGEKNCSGGDKIIVCKCINRAPVSVLPPIPHATPALQQGLFLALPVTVYATKVIMGKNENNKNQGVANEEISPEVTSAPIPA
jgi:hypothetical protein